MATRAKTEPKRAPGEGERAARRGYVHQDRASARLIYRHLLDRNLKWIGLADRTAGVADDLVLGLSQSLLAHQFKRSLQPKAFGLEALLLGAQNTVADLAAAFFALRTQFPATPVRIAYITNDYVRRLEAMRRLIDAPERQHDGSWAIGQNHLADAERFEREKSRRLPVRIETLSVGPLEQLAIHDGATWLDREMASDRPQPLSDGFGADVSQSLVQRQAWLVEQGLAEQEGQTVRLRRDLLVVLQQRELSRTSQQIEQETGLRHITPRRGEPIEGKAWLERKGAQELDQRFGPRLDRQNRTAERLERKVDALTEMLGLFIRHQLTLVADQPPFDSDTARLGRARYVSFMKLVEQRLVRADSGEVTALAKPEEQP